ncbi:hypothetical protein KI387_042961 [Taxus chinensis]|uniref:Glycosyltransferase family 92 protein n=1 Tax=Taxus chinensis TaxID=29808 RepID=A0AA38F867_TAXCH|nr:hypothetical protein KI387_042961 [Taxus chinensis]
MPSAAYYNIPEAKKDIIPNKLLCACTMVFNAAKFMKEWIIYHSHVGLDEFFIYDNSSEDHLEEVITESVQSGYNVSRRLWPWAKTQEAGFAHCSLATANKCKWVMFTDVDEFVFSHGWLQDLAASSNALKIMLLNKTSSSNRVGQVSMKCRNFGASNLKEHPMAGVTQGYTCREREERRHKSILLLEASSLSLMNDVVHHFELKPGYKTVGVKPSEAVINHYKYQVWSEFKIKLRRRAPAYVVDWKEGKNGLGSQDRAPGLGFEAVRPPDWETKFCQVTDTLLR